jgi:hypothetical protein
MRIGTALTVGGLVLAVPAAAGAVDDGDRSTSQVRLMGNLGFGSPVGLVGGTFTYAPRPQVQIELGSGIGFSLFQFSLMPKVTLGSKRERFVLGVGPSVGVAPSSAENCPATACVSYWLNAEAGFEFRSVGGFSFLMAIGVVKGLAGKMPGYGAPGVTEPGDVHHPYAVAGIPILPEARIAFGRWL